MFWHNFASSLRPAAVAMVVGAAAPGLAQNLIEPTLKAAETHGIAAGLWVAPSFATPGSMHGLLLDGRGQMRFELAAVTNAIVPSEIPGYDIGTLYGRLLSPRLEDDTAAFPVEEKTTPVERASIYVLGHWAVNRADGSGRFAAVAYVTIEPLPMPLVLLDIGGVFHVPASEVVATDDPVAEPALPQDPPEEVAICYAARDLYVQSESLADAVALLCRLERAEIVACVAAAGGIVIDRALPRAVRFQARWTTRD